MVVGLVVLEDELDARLVSTAALYEFGTLFGVRSDAAAFSYLMRDSALLRVCIRSSSTIHSLYSPFPSSCMMATMGVRRYSDVKPLSNVRAFSCA